MSDKKDEKKKKSFEEKILETFPPGWKPDFKPHKYDSLNDSVEQIIEASGAREIWGTFLFDEEDKKMFNDFVNGLIKDRSVAFNEIRDGLKDDKTRREVLKAIIESAKHGRS
jgi:hypothetical protein